MFRLISVLAILCSAFCTNAMASLYFVEPLICVGQWNKQPPQYHSSYEKVSLKVISFWSVRAKDCSKAPSTSTEVNYASAGEEVEVDPSIELGEWFAGPLEKVGNTVYLPNDVSANPFELEVVGQSYKNGATIEILKGRSLLYDDYYYDLECEAVLTQNPSHVENSTASCPD